MLVTFEQVKARLEDVREYDNYVAALCCFHDDHNPSMLVFRDGMFRCLSCGVVGDLEYLWRRLNGWSPTTGRRPTDWKPPFLETDPDKLEEMVEDAHTVLVENVLSLGWYLRQRKIDDRIEPCHLGWYNGWYIIPIYSRYKKNDIREFLGMVMRAGTHIQEATGRRYHMPVGQGSILYVPDHGLLERSNYVCAVFGIFDALALTSRRIPAVTCTTGQNFHPNLLRGIRKPIIVIPDKGEFMKGVALCGHLGWRGKLLRLAYDDEVKDPADYIQYGRETELLNKIRSKV